MYKAYLQWTLSSEVLTHALLYYSALHLQGLVDSKHYLSFEVLHHKGEVLRLVNHGLNDPVVRTTDATIGALAYLVVFEVSRRSDTHSLTLTHQ